MAEQAHKEPTMEEILASIRKIISEDDHAPASEHGQPAAPTLRPEDIADDEQSDRFGADELTFDGNEPVETGPDSDIFDEIRKSPPVDDTPDPFDTDDLGEFGADTGVEDEQDPTPQPTFIDRFAGSEDQDAASGNVLQIEEASEAGLPDDGEVEPFHGGGKSLAPEQEKTVMDHGFATRDALTEEATADAAAGALSRLVSRMEVGSENTLEGLVREMIKPMIKVWLDENLQRIVEEKVEAEVQRISRLAR
jgi:uncharacterized protein